MTVPIPVLGNVLSDLGNWVAGVFERIGDVSVYWLVLALGLKTAESAFIGLGWRNILRAAYPKSNLSFKIAWGASQGGTAINALTPAQAGTAAMIGLFRTSIPGSSVAGVTSATVVQSLFFTVASVLMVICVGIFRPHTVSKGSPSDETGGFFASHPVAHAGDDRRGCRRPLLPLAAPEATAREPVAQGQAGRRDLP